MPSRYFLRCLGAPELRGPAGEPIRFRTRKHLALLLYLAVEPRQAHRRDRLADILWPDAKLSEARHSLATALSVIRGKLGPNSYEATRDTVKLVAPELEVDLDRLLSGNVLGDEFTPPLEMGGFLDDFDVPSAPEFMHWCDQRRAHLFPTIRSGFVTLMDRRRRTGAFAQIEPLADRILQLDPLSEEGIRAKMEGRAFAGDRISAIRIYQEWKSKLQEELGASPSALVEGMALRLRQRGYEAPGTSHVPTVLTGAWRNRAFVGREDEYKAIYERWEQTKNGSGRHVLVLGDSGLGKTTLVERITTASGLEGAVTARVQCYEIDRQVPYSAIGSLVKGMLEQPGASATAPEWLTELTRSIPAVAVRFPTLPRAQESEGEAARIRLTEAVHQLASAVADEHPLILFVDDLHLADDASVAVLHLLMRRTQAQQVMLIATARQLELSQAPSASRLLDSQTALALEAVHIPLLSDGEIGLVISALASGLGNDIPPAVRHALIRGAAGVPMVAELLFDDWRKHKGECIALSVSAMTSEAVKHDVEVMDQVIGRVVNDLGTSARAVLGLAAVLGDRLNDLRMYELVDLSLAQTLAGMSELTNARILRDGGSELEFRNELLRGRAYLSVPSPLRRALHGLILGRLLEEEASGHPVSGLTLAWHCYRAGKEQQAHPHLLRGAAEAMARGAPYEAELALNSAIPRLAGIAREQATLLHCQALQEQGRWADSLSALHGIGTWAIANEAHKLALEIHAKSKTTPSATDCQALLDRAIKEINSLGNAAHPSLIAGAAHLAYYLSDKHRSQSLLTSLSAMEHRTCDLRTRMSILPRIASAAWTARQLSSTSGIRADLWQLRKECAAQGISDSSRFVVENTLGCLETTHGAYDAALMPFMSAYSTAELVGDDERAAYSAVNIAMCYGRTGRYSLQEEWCSIGIRRAPKLAATWRSFRAHYGLAWSRAMQGNYRGALESASQIVGTTSDSPSWLGHASRLLTADIYKLCGEHRKSISIARETLTNIDLERIGMAYVGVTARWLSICVADGVLDEESVRDLENLANERHSLDLFDQAELLTAWTWLLRKMGRSYTVDLDQARDALLSHLPSSTSLEFARLGFA